MQAQRILRTVGAALALLIAVGVPPRAASHREAPFLVQEPTVDITDLYAFNAYEPGREDQVVFVMNVYPRGPRGTGASLEALDPSARYDINIDNDGDSAADITFRFKFDSQYSALISPNFGGGDSVLPTMYRPGVGLDAAFVRQYTVSVLRGGTEVLFRDMLTSSTTFSVPDPNVGASTTSNYAAYADSFVYDVTDGNGGSGRLFVGDRQDSFHSNLAEVLDTVQFPPRGTRGNANALNTVTSMAIEVPKSEVTGTDPVIGVWATVSRPRTRTLVEDPTDPNDLYEPSTAPYIQVSRMGTPFFNELLVPALLKDKYNRDVPANDVANFASHVVAPGIATIFNTLSFNRTDLLAIHLEGSPGVNAGPGLGDMLRLNTEIPATPRDQQNPFGYFDLPDMVDVAGYPNGRRVGDDVVDAELRAIVGAIEKSDGVAVDATYFSATFPYLQPPRSNSDPTNCVTLTSSQDPQAGFAPVAGAFVERREGVRLVAPISGEEDISYYVVEGRQSDPALDITGVNKRSLTFLSEAYQQIVIQLFEGPAFD